MSLWELNAPTVRCEVAEPGAEGVQFRTVGVFECGIIHGTPVPVPVMVSPSGRWRGRRGTNRRMRKCLASSPRFWWLLRERARRFELRDRH